MGNPGLENLGLGYLGLENLGLGNLGLENNGLGYLGLENQGLGYQGSGILNLKSGFIRSEKLKLRNKDKNRKILNSGPVPTT